MCTPRPPKVQPIPDRQAARLPDNGDPLVRAGARKRKLVTQAMGLPNFGLPSVATTSTLGVG